MGRLSEIDWNLVQFEFEVLGLSLEDIQEKYELSENHLAYISKDWKQIPASQRGNLKFTDLSSLESVTDEIANQIAKEANSIQTIKQRHLLSKYLELENILLSKSLAVARNLDNTRASVNALNTLSNVITNLLELNPLLKPDVDPETGEAVSREWTVNIVGTEPRHTD